jgi:hypothetical protein
VPLKNFVQDSTGRASKRRCRNMLFIPRIYRMFEEEGFESAQPKWIECNFRSGQTDDKAVSATAGTVPAVAGMVM